VAKQFTEATQSNLEGRQQAVNGAKKAAKKSLRRPDNEEKALTGGFRKPSLR
jgi:hypothetical protein